MENLSPKSVQLLLNRHVENESSQYSPSIFMVPSQLRDVSPNSFNPMVVSIGPLHREDVNVQAFEEQKSTYLIRLMSRVVYYSKEEIWETCMQKAYTWMNKVKACYVWPKNKKYSDAEIAEMMVIDACFILEFTYQLAYDREEASSVNKMQLRGVIDDLVLLENQIPLFFLDEIYQCTISKSTSSVTLIQLINGLLYRQISRIISSTTQEVLDIHNLSVTTAPHILSLLHQCYMPPDYIEEVSAGSRIHSATDLDRAGVNFKPSQDPKWVMGIKMKQHKRFPYFFGSWSYNTTLTMPVLKVHDSTELLLRNLIAYEQQSSTTKSYVTSYVVAMDMLVNTQEDVVKLVDSRVLVNLMGSNEEAANMINNICKNVPYGSSFYEEEWKKMNNYCNGYWPKHIAWMRSTYFRSPWSIIALLSGVALFVLQVVQTVFTVMSSGNNK